MFISWWDVTGLRIFFFAHTSSISFHTSMWEQNGNKTKSMSFLLNCVNLNGLLALSFSHVISTVFKQFACFGGSNLIKKYVKKVQKLHKQLWKMKFMFYGKTRKKLNNLKIKNFLSPLAFLFPYSVHCVSPLRIITHSPNSAHCSKYLLHHQTATFCQHQDNF